jgi:GT2 family glycosyltransferase
MDDIAASVVVISHNEGEYLRRTVQALLRTTPPAVQVVVVDDHSSDASTTGLARSPRVSVVRPPRRLGVAAARNYGALAAAGQILVFSDAHVTPSPGWLPPLRAAIASGAAAVAPGVSRMGAAGEPGYGITWRDATLTTAWLHPRPPGASAVPMLCGCFMAIDRGIFESIGGFDEGLLTWGLEDAELSLRLWRMGHQCLVVPDSQVRHLFRPRFPYRVDWSTTLYNVLRLAVVHFGERALSRVLAQFTANPAFADAYSRVVDSDVWLRRSAVAHRCRFDDGWFFARFGIGALQ